MVTGGGEARPAAITSLLSLVAAPGMEGEGQQQGGEAPPQGGGERERSRREAPPMPAPPDPFVRSRQRGTRSGASQSRAWARRECADSLATGRVVLASLAPEPVVALTCDCCM